MIFDEFNGEFDIDFVVDAIREKLERLTEPKVLSLEELQEMDGKPIWIKVFDSEFALKSGWYVLKVNCNKDMFACNEKGQCMYINYEYNKLCIAYDSEPRKDETNGAINSKRI